MIELDRLEWLTVPGASQDVVLSTRIRLARNLSAHPFPPVSDAEVAGQVCREVQQALAREYPHWKRLEVSSLPMAQRALLFEQHLISPHLAQKLVPTMVAFSETGRFSLMVNEEDHLRLQVLLPGSALQKAWPAIEEVEKRLERQLDFAYHRRFGYLTSCLTNLGTGLRASVMLHLPALSWFNAIPNISRQIASVGLTARGLYGEGSQAEGHFLQISNQVTLGPKEVDIANKVESVAQHLVSSERQARGSLLTGYRNRIEDSVWRAWGVLTSARLLGSAEATEQLSLVRLGALLDLLPDLDPNRLLRLLIAIRPGNLQEAAGRELLPEERDWVRAEQVRRALTEATRTVPKTPDATEPEPTEHEPAEHDTPQRDPTSSDPALPEPEE